MCCFNVLYVCVCVLVVDLICRLNGLCVCCAFPGWFDVLLLLRVVVCVYMYV